MREQQMNSTPTPAPAAAPGGPTPVAPDLSRKRKNRIKTSTPEIIFQIVNYVLLTLIAIACLYPFVNTISTSLSSNRAILSGEVLIWPVELTGGAYAQIIEDGSIFRAMGNTVRLTVIGTTLNMLFTLLTAYPLSRAYWPGKKIFLGLIVFTMFFGGGMIPTFILIRTLNLMDTYGALWMLSLYSIGNVIILRTFIQTLPKELEESAFIDGASDLRVLTSIILPLSKAVLATLTLFYLVGWWNAYFQPLIYINDERKQVLMLRLRQLLDASQMAQSDLEEMGVAKEIIAPESFKAATIMVSTIPIVCVYPFLQKYFVKGVMIGSIKG